jgi:hypothetical protein
MGAIATYDESKCSFWNKMSEVAGEENITMQKQKNVMMEKLMYQ